MSYMRREEIKLQRLKKKRQQRLATLIGIAGVIMVVGAMILLPNVIEWFRPPGAFVSITPQAYPQADGRAIGNPDALVVLEIFTDFQCKACKKFASTTEMQLLANEYITNGQVYYIARHYPFMDNSSAIKISDQAANASMCAAEQNRFWDYHTIVFVNQNSSRASALSDRQLVTFAESLGLDMDKFQRCFEDDAYAAEIQADIDRATLLNVTGTPSVFVNGQKVGVGTLVPSYEEIISAIETALLVK